MATSDKKKQQTPGLSLIMPEGSLFGNTSQTIDGQPVTGGTPVTPSSNPLSAPNVQGAAGTTVQSPTGTAVQSPMDEFDVSYETNFKSQSGVSAFIFFS